MIAVVEKIMRAARAKSLRMYAPVSSASARKKSITIESTKDSGNQTIVGGSKDDSIHVAHAAGSTYKVSGGKGSDTFYIESTTGTYTVTIDDFTIGTPLYDHAVLHLPNGRDLTIIAPRRDPRAIYVRDIRLNGQRLPTLTITQQQLLDGGTLAFRMVTKHR